MVNTQVLKGQWNEVRGQLKKKWGQLTDDDLKVTDGDIDQVVGIIQRKTGEAREGIEQFLDTVTAQGASAVSGAADSVSQYGRIATDRMRDGYNRLSGELGREYEMWREMIREKPAQSVAAAFGFGILVGIVVGLALRSR
ncbi:MAG: CsbD family protein [Isosphaeraceae bacterium]